MELPLAIHKDANSVYGVTIPDVPGCYSYGDTIDDAIRNARSAVYQHCEAMAAESMDINIRPSAIEELYGDEEYAGAIWAMVDVDLSKLDSKPERINVSIPRFVLKRIDEYAEKRHETRSGLLSRAAMALIEAEHAA